MTTSEGRGSYLDEDSGSLDAAARLLALAEDDGRPRFDRFRILADVGRFLDELYQLAGGHLRSSSADRRDAVADRVQALVARQSGVLEGLRASLASAGVEIRGWAELGDDDRRFAAAVFRDRLRPVLAPLVAEPDTPLPPAANLSLNLAVGIRAPGGHRRLATVELPPVAPRFLRLRSGRSGGLAVVPVEQVVEAHLEALFPGGEIESCAAFRVTRQAGVVPSPDGGDMLASVERQLRTGRHGVAVRLEVEARIPAEVIERLRGDLDLTRHEVHRSGGLLGLADLHSLPLPDGGPPARLRARPPAGPSVAPVRPSGRRTADVMGALDRGELLAHFPYDSYDGSVGALLDQASTDPSLLAIKQTLYRPSPDGPTMQALLRAAERGAHVVAVVELGARLAERDSVACARTLERAGCHVVYGLVGLRTHCFLTLVVRHGGDRVSRYGVVGTGLHHPTRRPEGLALLSADSTLTADLTDLFNYLTGYSRPARFRTLLVGPSQLRARLLEAIAGETAAGPAGRIALKVYRLVDREVIDALYRAAQRGVAVDLVVGGACALRPGVPGLSEGIRVVAPLGRHFETSRLFAFGSGESRRWFLSSGDLARTHLDRQVDVAVAVGTPSHRARLEATLDLLLRCPAWEMDADGHWRHRGPGAEEALRRLAPSAATGRGGASLRR